MEVVNEFPATRAAALERLEEFAAHAPRYAARRNHVVRGHGHVSRLSAALAHRLITEAEVVEAVLRRHPFRAVEKFVQEVVWRAYWKGWLEMRPAVWDRYRMSAGAQPMDPAALAAAEGRSSSAVMNHFARELLETGYLHNHARMWWASFWVHHCGLPWELGARHFARHLLDADAASNTLSWRWVAGLQTRGKAYLASSENIRKFCTPEILEAAGGIGLRDGAVARLPALDRHDDPRPMPALPHQAGNSLERTALLVHDEDLSVECGPAAALRPALLLQFASESAGPSPRERWLALARADAVRRAGEHFRAGVHSCAGCGEIARACAEAGVGRLVMVEPFAGPLREALVPLAGGLADGSVVLERVRRRWDAELLPLATRGFFPFWSKVGRRLEKHGVGAFR